MRSKIAEKIASETPEEVKIFVRLYADLLIRVNELLKQNEFTQSSLAQKMKKTPSEISKWMNGEHNFTLKSIAKLQAELGGTLIEVPKFNKKAFFVESKERRYSNNSIQEKSKAIVGSRWVSDNNKPNNAIRITNNDGEAQAA